MMLQIIITDDEPLACELLLQHISKLQMLQVKAVFHNANSALTFLENNSVDVIFLDIEMPEMSGIEFLKQLAQPPLTVFTTAYRDYAFEGYELGVIDFLLKPISLDRFAQSVQKVRDFILLRDKNSQLQRGNLPAGEIFVKSGVQKIKLQLEDVSFIQGLKDYAIIHHSGGKIVVKGSVKAMHGLFHPDHFIRVHKSFMVAKAKILRIERNTVILKSQKIPLGRTYKEALMKLLDAK